MQIIGLILTYISMLIVFYSLMLLIKLDKQEKRKKCMMNHPAGRHVPTAHSLIGLTETDFQSHAKMGGKTSWINEQKPHHLEGD